MDWLAWTWLAMKLSSSPNRSMDIFKEAKQAGLHVTIHAGEWGPAENVRDAIENLGAERIGHGVRVMEDETVVALGTERERYLKYV